MTIELFIYSNIIVSDDFILENNGKFEIHYL